MEFIVEDIKHINVKVNVLTLLSLQNTLSSVSLLQCINTKVQT